MSKPSSNYGITEQHIKQFRNDGYFILQSALSPEQLALLRAEAQFSIDRMDAQMDALQTDVIGISHRNRRYFAANVFRQRPALEGFLFGDLMAELCRATLGQQAYLFWEQYVIKCAEGDMRFSWHQDSGYIGHKHKPFMTCWIALDDVDEENGTVYLLPQSVSGIRTWVKHEREPDTNDMVGYFGREPGVPVVGPAGSIAVFASTTFHRSGPNLSGKTRRVYLAQYSEQVICKNDGTPWENDIAFLDAGRVVAQAR